MLLLIMGGEVREGGGGGKGGLDWPDPYLLVICDVCIISGAESLTTGIVPTVGSLHLEAGMHRMKPRARLMMGYWKVPEWWSENERQEGGRG